MTFLRLLLVLIFTAITLYTGVVIANHGLNLLLPVFYGDMATLAWPGQFNLDFMCMLALSGLWVAWRHCSSGSRDRPGRRQASRQPRAPRARVDQRWRALTDRSADSNRDSTSSA
jgi:hypothetical protein